MAAPFPSRKWVFGMEGMARSDRTALISSSEKLEPTGQMEPRDEGARAKSELTRDKKKEFITKRAWDMAIAPGKQFAMTAFMMWMMGSGVHIMNMIFTFYQLVAPIKGMFSVNKVFEGMAESAKELGVDLTLQKLVFIAAQLAVLLFITYRFGSMGLLPTTASDWLAAVPPKTPAEYSAGGIPFSTSF